MASYFLPFPAFFNRVQGGLGSASVGAEHVPPARSTPLQASTPVSASAENGRTADCGAHNPVLVKERLHHLW